MESERWPQWPPWHPVCLQSHFQRITDRSEPRSRPLEHERSRFGHSRTTLTRSTPPHIPVVRLAHRFLVFGRTAMRTIVRAAWAGAALGAFAFTTAAWAD